jgi:hypothetical protein
VRKDGGVFWANVVIDPIKDEQGMLVGFSKITRDGTVPDRCGRVRKPADEAGAEEVPARPRRG